MIISRLTASATVFAIAATAAVFQFAMPAAHGVNAEPAQPVVQLERVIVTGKATTTAATARL